MFPVKLIFVCVLLAQVLVDVNSSRSDGIVESSKNNLFHKLRLNLNIARGIRKALSRIVQIPFVKFICPGCANVLKEVDPVIEKNEVPVELKVTIEKEDVSTESHIKDESESLIPIEVDSYDDIGVFDPPSTLIDILDELGVVEEPEVDNEPAGPRDDDESRVDESEVIDRLEGIDEHIVDHELDVVDYQTDVADEPAIIKITPYDPSTDDNLQELASRSKKKPTSKHKIRFLGNYKIDPLMYVSLSIILLVSSISLLLRFMEKKSEFDKKVSDLQDPNASTIEPTEAVTEPIVAPIQSIVTPIALAVSPAVAANDPPEVHVHVALTSVEATLPQPVETEDIVDADAANHSRPMKKISYVDAVDALNSHITNDDDTNIGYDFEESTNQPAFDATLSSIGTDNESPDNNIADEGNTSHDKYWNYAAYYGENLARQYYGSASPPRGTKPPDGYTIPSFVDESFHMANYPFAESAIYVAKDNHGSIYGSEDVHVPSDMAMSVMIDQPGIDETTTLPTMKRSESLDEDLLADYINRHFDVMFVEPKSSDEEDAMIAKQLMETPKSQAAPTIEMESQPTDYDPTMYYTEFWQYVAVYGEESARLYYGEWSPPVGSPAPINPTMYQMSNDIYNTTPYQSRQSSSLFANQSNELINIQESPQPTDPYHDFWLYAAYYGEDLARQFYEAAPPIGTAMPEYYVGYYQQDSTQQDLSQQDQFQESATDFDSPIINRSARRSSTGTIKSPM